MDHHNTVEELRAEIKDLRIRVRLDEKDEYAAKRLLALEFYLTDKLYFRRLYHNKAIGRTTPDPIFDRLGVKLDRLLHTH